MSLDYRLPNGMTNNDISDEDWPKFQTLVFATMTMGAQPTDQLKADALYQRMLMWYRGVYGEYETPIDLAFVRRFAGLSTNASLLTDAAFFKRLRERMLEQTAWKVDEEATAIRNENLKKGE